MGNYVACKKYKKKKTKWFHKFYEHPFGINCKKLCRYRHRYSTLQSSSVNKDEKQGMSYIS